MSRQTRRNQVSPAEQLELRVLPTVNVAFNAGSGLLKVRGDNNDNSVEIEGLGTPGHVEVFVDGNSVGEFENVRSIKANMKGGDDGLFLAALQIEGNVTANMGDGADEFDVDDTGRAVDQGVFIGGFTKVNMGNDRDDYVDLDDAIQFVGSATFSGVADVDMNGDGVDSTPELDKDITFYSNLNISYSGFGDKNGDDLELDLDNVNVGGNVTIDGSNNVERVRITSSFFQNEFNADMDDGDDVINIDNGFNKRNFFGQANFRGGDDNDTLFKGIDNVFANLEQITGFETIV
ncbi:MAG: hypothetical protein KDA36_11960 [Planctomycetaceae bacterium]|nr:hypothetical protein [Planctomycetaceae bacterium]